MKTLAIVSGGDAPGINAALWQFARLAEAHGDAFVGADGGIPAAVHGEYRPLTARQLATQVPLAGSVLASSRQPILSTEEGRQAFAERLRAENVDSVMLFGGDGTLRYVLPLLLNLGIACIALPTTIDNDVAGTERTLGFDSACNFAYQSVDGALATGHALPGRIFTLETLGGFNGNLALAIAHGAGAHAVLVPEIEYTHDWLGSRVSAALARDQFALVVHSEGIKESRSLPELLEELTGTRVRDIRLGHAQRGAKPTHIDRVLGADMAHMAHSQLKNGTRLGVTVVQHGKLTLHHGDLSGFPTVELDRGLYERLNA